MEKGQIIELTIEDMSGEGQGIGRDQDSGMVVFVPDSVPGDVVRAELTKVKKSYAFSRLVETVQPSEYRSEDVCPYAREGCGGCTYGSLNYYAQVALKENQVRSKLERLAGASFADDMETGDTGDVSIFAAEFNPIIGAAAPYNYRNKAVMPVSTGGLITKKGGIQEPVHEPRIGFRPPRSNEVIDCEDCWLQAPTAMAAARATRQFMIEDNITSYDERWGKGLMEGMTVKTAFGTGEVMVIYDINDKGIPNAAKLIEYLDEGIYEAGGSLESVVIRSYRGSGKSGKGSKSGKGGKAVKSGSAGKTKIETLAGKPTITDTVEIETDEGIREYNFEISSESFYQVNPIQMQNLYSVVRDYCQQAAWSVMGSDADGDEWSGEASDKVSDGGVRKPVVLDLYCGIGTIGLCVADLAEHVHGIEIVKEAVVDANRNATINGIVNATYEWGKAEELIPKWLEEGNTADIAILDPPRAGCKPELLEAIAKAGIPNIIYVSCDPATLARDIRLLKEGLAAGRAEAGSIVAETGSSKVGALYELQEVTPVDMFPHTAHVETVVLMSRASK